MALQVRYAAFTVIAGEGGAVLLADGEYFDSASPNTVLHARRWEIPEGHFEGLNATQIRAKLNERLDAWGALMKRTDQRGAAATTALSSLVNVARNVP